MTVPSFAVYATETFQKELEKLERSFQDRVTKLYLKLKDNPYVGDQLRYRFLREKRIDEKRVYYLVYEDLGIVLFVAISGKKDQQKTIDYLTRHFDEFRIYAENLSFD